MNSNFKSYAETIDQISNGKKILFATVAADGHFNPLTGLAVHLKNIGYDVRWYTSALYEKKANKLKIPFYPFKRALEARGDNLEEVFPERKEIKGKVEKLNFDIINFFIGRATEYYDDIKEIHETFPFDLMIADCCFTGIAFVKELMNKPVISIGIVPLPTSSKDLAPTGLGLVPSNSFLGKIKEAGLRWAAKNILFKKSNQVLAALCADNNIAYNGESIFDFNIKKATIHLQSATPGFEYYRSDLGENIKYIGALLPYSSSSDKTPWFDERLNKYEKVILVTQGTVEKDIKKLLIPTLEAFKGTDVLVVATTGSTLTSELRERFPEENIIIEDFIPFTDVMPYADVYVSNGGYGGVLLAIENQLPLVVAGVHEGKNEINARIGYFKLGINLKTEYPIPTQIRKAVDEVLRNNLYKKNVVRLGEEFNQYNPNKLCANAIVKLIQPAIFETEEASTDSIY